MWSAYRSGNFVMAKQKAEQLLSEYPNSGSAEKVKAFLDKMFGFGSRKGEPVFLARPGCGPGVVV